MDRFEVLDLILVYRYIERTGERMIPQGLAKRTADVIENLLSGVPIEGIDEDNEPF